MFQILLEQILGRKANHDPQAYVEIDDHEENDEGPVEPFFDAHGEVIVGEAVLLLGYIWVLLLLLLVLRHKRFFIVFHVR